MEDEAFLGQFQPSELKIVSEFLTNWLCFLSKDLCEDCVNVLSNRIHSLDPDHCVDTVKAGEGACNGVENGIDCDWKESGISFGSLSEVLGSVTPSRQASAETSSPRMSWADMSQEDEFEEEEEDKEDFDASPPIKTPPEKPTLSREQRENLRLKHVKRKKDFVCLERVKGKIVNIVDGLELHTGVLSAVEQKKIVDRVYELQEKGRKGELKDHTFTAPRKWMRGKGRVTIQFGCCYNYATDKDGNPPGILRREEVDPLPSIFKVIIRRLIQWNVLPSTCVPDSCIVNIYDEGDCIPPHIDNHDFLRPFCTISFLSECNILFGSNLSIEGPGEFSGPFSIPLPVGSVLVLNGNGADVAKHCVPAVPYKRLYIYIYCWIFVTLTQQALKLLSFEFVFFFDRISITFRKMDESKRPVWFTPDPSLQGIEPLPSLEHDRSVSAAEYSRLNNQNGSNQRGYGHGRRGRGNSYETRGYYSPERSNQQYDAREWSSSQRRGKPHPSRT
ncbi:unnamed protein product [Cochlearia groenlandica]